MPFQKGHDGFRDKESYKKAGKVISQRIAERIKRQGFMHSPETRIKLSIAHLGKRSWNQGYIDRNKYPKMGNFGERTPGTRQRMSLAHLGKFTEDESWNWKGNKVGYRGLHDWVGKKLGKANHCSVNMKHIRPRYHWANKSHEYKRDLDDWIQLCPSCHKFYDNGRLVLSH
jgi:hypothetical protein